METASSRQTSVKAPCPVVKVKEEGKGGDEASGASDDLWRVLHWPVWLQAAGANVKAQSSNSSLNSFLWLLSLLIQGVFSNQIQSREVTALVECQKLWGGGVILCIAYTVILLAKAYL